MARNEYTEDCSQLARREATTIEASHAGTEHASADEFAQLRPHTIANDDDTPPAYTPHFTVLVVHSSPLAAAGLTTVPRRLEGRAVRAWHMVGEAPQLPGAVTVGDPALTAQLASCTCTPSESVGQAGSKLVLLTNSTRRGDGALTACVSVWQSVDSLEQELLSGVQSLLGDLLPAIEPAQSRPDVPPGGAKPGVVGARGRPTGGLAPSALRKVRDHIDVHLTQKIDLSRLARIAGLSKWHFSKAFKQSTGIAPRRYVLMRRLAAAAELIRTTSKPLSEVAVEVGFSDQSHFTNTFTQLTGETPGALRRRHR